MTQPKKQKKAEEDPFAIVKQYLLDCPHLPANHPVIKAAIEGVEKEEKKQARDAKLQAKFAKSAAASSSSSAVKTTSNNNSALADGVLVMVPRSNASDTVYEDAAAMESEWQDVEPTVDDAVENDIPNSEDAASSYLGRTLAKSAIDRISEHSVKVSTPLSAIALVIHAALRSELLGFACTGIPEASTSGFAAPVRELPKSQFVPQRWDNDRKLVQLRYRKDGTGALKLIVQLEKSSETNDEDKVQVQLVPANSQEPPSQTLKFAVKDHINMDSWKAATAKTKRIAPALHFKFLPVLLTKFCQMYDLGESPDDGETNSIPYVDNTITTNILNPPAMTTSTNIPAPPPQVPVAAVSRPWQNGSVPSTLDQAFPQIAVGTNQGHFAGDLAPAGLQDPLRIGGSGRMGGNLMGPNHPHFMGGGRMGGPGMFPGGPGSMQPRFDPVLPPGAVDIGIDGRPLNNRPSRSGNPNPDHLRPPNSFAGDSMFM